MRDKIALQEHAPAEAMNALWNDAGKASRNGKDPSQLRIYEGYSSLVGSAWAFGHETSTHAVRLILSGLFDRCPSIQVILGHLGEDLPFTLPRLEHRLYMQRNGTGLGVAKEPVSHYFNRNFLLTKSGHFHTRTLECAINEIGSDRVREQLRWRDRNCLDDPQSRPTSRRSSRTRASYPSRSPSATEDAAVRTAIIGVGNIGPTMAVHVVAAGKHIIRAAQETPEASS